MRKISGMEPAKVRIVDYDLRKYSFCNRVTNLWNSLPNEVVTASSLNIFKNRLDKHWIHQDVIYDWRVDILGRVPEAEIIFFN